MLNRWLVSASLVSLLIVAGTPATSAQPSPDEKKEPEKKDDPGKRRDSKRRDKKDDEKKGSGADDKKADAKGDEKKGDKKGDAKADADKKAADAKKADDDKKAAAKKADDDKKAADAKKADDDKKAGAKKADDDKKAAAKADEDKKAAAKKADDDKKAAAKKADDDKKAAAKKADDDKKAAAKKADDDKKAADAKKADDDKKAGAKKADDDKKAAAKKADDDKKTAAKKADDDKKAAAKKADDDRKAAEAKRADDDKKAAEARKVPHEAPPAPREERRRARPGFVFIPGRWEWKAGKWEWLAGRSERERAGKKWRDGHWDKKGDIYAFTDGDWVDDAPSPYPREAPPAPKQDRRRARANHVLIPGRWDWKGGKWEWVEGREEAERPGKKFREGHWDKKGDTYAFTEGDWIDDASAYPREAPPAPRVERRRARPGHVIIAGRWDWRGGKWEWLAGREEVERPGKKWREGHWDKKGDAYAFTDGDWIDDAPAASPREAPPAPREDRRRARAGHVLIPGRWDWKGGKWEWVEGSEEAERPGKKFREGRWEKKGDTYAFTDGDWVDDAATYPREAPPAPREDRRRARAGYVLIPGRWDWRNNKWEWVEGREEAQRPGKRFREGRWDKKGDTWAYVEGDWAEEGPREAPPPPRKRGNNRPGFVLIPGRWEWKNSKWGWIDEHYEREQTGKRFREGRWEKTGDSWAFIDGEWVGESEPDPAPPIEEPRRGQRVDRPVVGNFYPPKGKPGTRISIQGRNFSPTAVVLWDGQQIRARFVSSDEIELRAPANAKTGELTLRDPARRRDLQVGTFEVVAGFDADAERKKIEAERKAAAEAAIKARNFVAARAAREAAVRARAEDYATKREQRRTERIAALRAKWAREVLASEDVQFELTLYAQRSADLHRMSEVAELKNDVRLAVRIDVARQREDSRHDRRMELLKTSFKGGKP